MTRLSRASVMTSMRGGRTCRAPSPPRNTTRLCRISSLANSNELEEMSIRFFSSACRGTRAHTHAHTHQYSELRCNYGLKCYSEVTRHLFVWGWSLFKTDSCLSYTHRDGVYLKQRRVSVMLESELELNKRMFLV